MTSNDGLTPFQNYIFKSRYARWVPEKEKREDWEETIHRYIEFISKRLPKDDRAATAKELEDAILHMEVMPSMRAMMTAGKALEKDEVAAYNCSYVAIDDPRAFDEAMYISMCGVGVGFSVERQYVGQLPIIAENFYHEDTIIKVRDSKIGWSTSFRQLIALLYGGLIPKWDLSAVRPAGSLLKTFGGRASGPEPLDRLFKFVVQLFKGAAGRKLTSLECHDLMCMIADVVVSGGVRRSAMISLSNLSDDRMRNAKTGQWWIENPQRALANNSAVYTEKPEIGVFMREWLSLYESRSGERGIYNREAATKKAILAGRRKWKDIEFGVNPCLTGHTLVYVADGRGNVPIRQLADEGKDVPVFCLDAKGAVAVRWMRNPRLTGHQVPIMKVVLDDGSTIRATPDDKLRLKSGEDVAVKDLSPGQSLDILTRFGASIKDVFKQANSKSQDYLWVNHGQRQNVAEHRLIYAFHSNAPIPRRHVVHHKDFHALHNHPDNLMAMTKKGHNALHSLRMQGGKNPMVRAQLEWSDERWMKYSEAMSHAVSGDKNGRYCGVTDDALREHALALTRQAGQRFTAEQWQEYAKERGLPQSFSAWRKSHLGGMMGLAKWAALQLGYDHVNADPRLVRTYALLTRQGYDCEMAGGSVLVNKRCEVCATPFSIDHRRREAGICGHSCASKLSNATHREKILAGMRSHYEQRRQDSRESQLKVFADLRFAMGRVPTKIDWVKACKAANVSAEISRPSSPFVNFSRLVEASKTYNHRVVSVESCGVEDVYDGTVDEFHNFFIGAFEGKCRNGKPKWIYLNHRQCGEIILRSKGLCNLTEVVVRPNDTRKTLLEKVRKATILGTLQSTLTEFRYLRKEWQKNAEEERLLGVSLTGIMDSPMMSANGPDLAALLDELRLHAVEVNAEWAAKMGITPSVAVTCLKPSGTVSQLVNCSPGIHTRYAPWLLRAVREDRKNPIGAFLKACGIPSEPDVTKPDEVDVFFFPLASPEGSITRNKLTAIEQLELYLMYRQHWTEHNPSTTIYVRDQEWLEVATWVYKHFDQIGGIAFLPFTNHIYKQAPYTEISEEEYRAASLKMPEISWSKLSEFETEDHTTAMKEIACSNGSCDL